MFLSTRDFEFLKLLCWCKNIPTPAEIDFTFLYATDDIAAIESIGLLSVSRDGKHIRPRLAAYRFLEDVGCSFKAELKPQTGAAILKRRNIAAQILLTFYRAGISVFNDTLSKTLTEPVYIASFAARQSEPGNPFGSTRFYGIFCTPQEAFLVLYADDVGVYYEKELALFYNLAGLAGIKRTSIIIMGKSTSEIGMNAIYAKRENKRKKKYNTDTFSEIFEITTLPLHFIPLGDSGAQILRFLLIPNYREAIAKAALMDSHKPPIKGHPDTDAVHYKKPNYPAVVAVDMDVNRIDRAVAKAQSAGVDKIVLYALREQIPFLKNRYFDTGTAELLILSIDKIRKELKNDIDLYNPPKAPYITTDGRYFDVSDIAAYRKAGKQARQEDGPVSESK